MLEGFIRLHQVVTGAGGVAGAGSVEYLMLPGRTDASLVRVAEQLRDPGLRRVCRGTAVAAFPPAERKPAVDALAPVRVACHRASDHAVAGQQAISEVAEILDRQKPSGVIYQRAVEGGGVARKRSNLGSQ